MTDFGSVLVSGLEYEGGLENKTHIKQFTSNPVKGPGLEKYTGSGTIQIHTINLTGNIQIEATLSKDSNCGPWVIIPLTNTMNSNVSTVLNFVFPNPVPGISSSALIQTNNFYSIVGQYAWLRANVWGISTGSVELVKLSF